MSTPIIDVNKEIVEWEYARIKTSEILSGEWRYGDQSVSLDEMGSKGWELINIITLPPQGYRHHILYVAFLKRRY